MVYAAFAILLLGAAACFAAARVAPTRLLGLGAAAGALVAALMVALTPAIAEGPPATLLELGEAVFSVGPTLSDRAVGTALLLGGGASLLALAGAIAPTVRGFGGIFAWSLLTLAAALLSLAAPPLSMAQPLAWAVLALGGYASLRASGAATGEGPPLGLTFGLLASALLAGGLLATAGQVAAGALPTWPAALCGLVAALALAGSPPLAGARAEASEAPPPLSALIFGLAAPAAALGWLLRAVATLPILPNSWSITLGLLGGVGALACGAGALGVRGLRGLLAWIAAGQTAAVVAAVGLAGPLGALAGPGLLVGLMLTTALGAGAAESFERTTGSDDYTTNGSALHPLIGVVWAGAAAAALGLPPLWSFWPRLWLLEAAQEQQPWLLPLLVAAAVLSALALLAPLARLWGDPRKGEATRLRWTEAAPAALAALPLLLFGLAPGLAWAWWLQHAPFAPTELPVGSGAQLAAVAAGLALAALVAGLARRPTIRALRRDPEEEAVVLAPDALGATLRPLAWLANPEPLLQAAWAGLQAFSRGLRLIMSLFEQRYYLLGVLAALLIIMLLMAQ